MATFPSKVNYATGDILTATNMNDVGGAINLLDGAQFAAGKNKIINGAFDVWQRGTSIALADGAYTADRFLFNTDGGTAGTGTVTRQAFTPATAPVAGYEGNYFARYNLATAGTSSFNYFRQRIENVTTFAGQTVTISFWAKADSGRTITSQIGQRFGTGGSATVFTTGASYTLTTSWVRYTTTVAIPSISGKTIGTSSNLELGFYWACASGMTIDFWGWQMEAAQTASPFQTATGTLQGELAACQRYYYRQNANASSAYAVFGTGFANTTGLLNIPCQFPVTMRTKPTALDTAAMATYGWEVGVSLGTTPTSITIDSNYSSADSGLAVVAKAAAFVVATYYRFEANANSGAYLGWSAEL
jgi:hypothetical protein